MAEAEARERLAQILPQLQVAQAAQAQPALSPVHQSHMPPVVAVVVVVTMLAAREVPQLAARAVPQAAYRQRTVLQTQVRVVAEEKQIHQEAVAAREVRVW